MKDDEKKSQRKDMQFPDEEDMDFEILDALEQLDQNSPQQDIELSEDTIELTLDDNDMDFGDNVSESGSGFSFDDNLREGLEQELLQGDTGFDLDESLEDELVKEIQTETEKDSFALDLDLDDEFPDEETGLESDDSAFDMSAAETLVFNFNEQNAEAKMHSQEGEGSDELSSYDLDLGSESEDINLDDFSHDDENFPELDLGIEGVEIDENFADLGTDIDLDSSLEQENEDESIPGKAVIAVGDDEVIDLGDEEHLQQEQLPEIREQEEPSQLEPETEQPLVESEEKQIHELATEEEAPSVPDIMLDLHEEADGDFMSSLGDMDIGLEKEEGAGLEGQNSFTDEEQEEEFPAGGEDIEAGDFAEEEQLDSENTDMADLAQEVLEARKTEDAEEERDLPEIEEDLEPEAEEIPEENVEPAPAEEIDVREFLGLSLRLSDEQIEEFEGMVNEAKTLQTYLDELEKHYDDVKENIYHKLQVEYVARKTVIFKSPEFTALFSDVGKDLEDMLTTRAEFVETVERLNEELEEIKVRHLVGEFDDATVTEKQDSQNAEIALWNEKTEKIEVFIVRNQGSLDAEKALNPIGQEQTAPSEEEELPQDAEAASAEEIDVLAETPEAETEDEGEEFAVDEEETDTEEEGVEGDLPEEEEIVEEESSASFLEAEAGEELETPEEGTESEPDVEDFFATGEEEAEEDDGLDGEFPMDGNFDTGDFVLDDLSGFEDEDEEEEDDASVAYKVEGFGDDDTEAAAVTEDGDMVTCSKCGRQTPAIEKFCVHCGGKAQKAEKDADVSCKKCGRQTPAAEKFCIHCGGKAQ